MVIVVVREPEEVVLTVSAVVTFSEDGGRSMGMYRSGGGKVTRRLVVKLWKGS